MKRSQSASALREKRGNPAPGSGARDARPETFGATIPSEDRDGCAGQPLRSGLSQGNSQAASVTLCASDSLVLQDPDHDAPVLGLPFGSFVVTYLPAFAHGAWRQHSGQRNVALL
jgi:hypothetical protein